MRALAISDMHFGAWTGEPLLRHQFALDALEPHLEDIDELILLGDVFDFLFSPVEQAFAQAEPLFTLIHDQLQGKRVVFLAGNHDHHIVVRFLRAAVELKIATGASAEALSDLFCAEHHMLFTVAQMPRGTAAQQAFYAQFQRLGRLLQLPATARRDAGLAMARSVDNLSAIASRLRREFARRHATGVAAVAGSDHNRRLDDHAIRSACQIAKQIDPVQPVPMELPGVRACDPTAPTAVALEAYATVVRNLDWGRGVRQLVFAHTHQPLDGVCDASQTIRFWNTGSWIYEPPPKGTDAYTSYLERAWPGTGVMIDTDREAPVLIEMLSDYNPMRAERSPQSRPNALARV